MIERRTVLRMGATATVVSLAGCQQSPGQRSDGGDGNGATGGGSGNETTGEGGDGETDGSEERDSSEGGSTAGWPLVYGGPQNRSTTDESLSDGLSEQFHWEYSFEEDTDSASMVYSTPVCDGDRAYLHVTGSGYSIATGERQTVGAVVALDASSGEKVWERGLGSDPGLGNASVPALGGEQLLHAYFGVRGLDPADGTVTWANEESVSYGNPAVYDGSGYWFYNRLNEVALADGESGWNAAVTPDHTPAVTDATIFVSEYHSMVAIDRETGEENWRREHDAFPSLVSDEGMPLHAPVVGEQLVFTAAGEDAFEDRDYGGLLAFDRESGEIGWTFDFEEELGVDQGLTDEERRAVANGSNPNLTGIYGPPALADGTLYANARVGEGETELLAIDATSGALEWRTPTAGVSQFATVAGESVFIVSRESIERFDRADGTRTNELSTSDQHSLQFPPAIANGMLYVPTYRGIVAYGP